MWTSFCKISSSLKIIKLIKFDPLDFRKLRIKLKLNLFSHCEHIISFCLLHIMQTIEVSKHEISAH